MLKSKLIAAGILSIGALAFTVPAAMASNMFSNRNYSGRYACHEEDGTGSQLNAFVVGGVSAAYVVQPNGMGAYNGGDFVLNISALFGANPCTFTLDTATSWYNVDSSGVAHEYLYWTDWADDACSGASFDHSVEGSLVLVSPYATASQTVTTTNTDLGDFIGIDFAGSGNCSISAN
jgi:hypothetical protein